jgi:hypothetical protein
MGRRDANERLTLLWLEIGLRDRHAIVAAFVVA